MQEVFEKIKERLEEAKVNIEPWLEGCTESIAENQIIGINGAIEIVNQVAEEFAPDINVGNSWEIVYDKVLKLEKEYAMSGDIENVNDCIRLENLLQYFKEELRDENNQSLTNDGWILFTQREMTEEEKEFFGEDTKYMLDCKLPEEDEEILVTHKFKGQLYVCYDIFLKDGSLCYLDSGLEFIEEAIAWQPLPEPYRGE